MLVFFWNEFFLVLYNNKFSCICGNIICITRLRILCVLSWCNIYFYILVIIYNFYHQNVSACVRGKIKIVKKINTLLCMYVAKITSWDFFCLSFGSSSLFIIFFCTKHQSVKNYEWVTRGGIYSSSLSTCSFKIKVWITTTATNLCTEASRNKSIVTLYIQDKCILIFNTSQL